MFVTAIGIIKDIDDSIIGYRLIDIDDNNKVLDVTKGQILNALRNKQITIENMELKGNKLVGTYYDIKLLPDIIGSNCDINVNIALLAKDGIVTVSNCIGNVCNIAVNKALSMPNIVNIINGDIKCVCENAYVTPSNKQAKFKMALYNTKYSVLLNDEYINNIEFLYKIILRLENNEYTNKEFILNTDKFLYRPLSDFRYLHGISGNKTDTLNYKFISLCNLLTTILDNDIRCFSDRFIHNMSKLSVIRSSTIYEDSNNSIFVTSAQVDRDLYNILYIV